MRKRLAFVASAAAVAWLMLTGTAFAALTVTGHGVTNPIAWGLKSGQWAYVWVTSDATSSWADVDVLSSKGVVATIYHGALASRPLTNAGARLFPAWNGKDASGHYLATGNYKYRIRLSRGTQTTEVSGPVAVSKSRFTLQGPFVSVERYLYRGRVLVYWRAYVAPGRTRVWLDSNAGEIGTVFSTFVDYAVAGDSPVWTRTNSLRGWAWASRWYWVNLKAWDPDAYAWEDDNGSYVEVTIMQ